MVAIAATACAQNMQEPVESIHQEKTLIHPIVYETAALYFGGATMNAKLDRKCQPRLTQCPDPIGEVALTGTAHPTLETQKTAPLSQG
jgi:hypothetical protein